jgi:hypothetical protein
MLTLVSCGSETGVGSGDAASPDVNIDGDIVQDTAVVPDLGTFDTGQDGDTDAQDGDDAGADGSPCNSDDDCDSGQCLDLTAGEASGICTTNCNTDADCPEGWDCTLLSNSGQDAIQVCIPVDYCADADGDNFGVGPGCRGQDCNDSDDGVNLSADEVCDGIDNDCDELTDENPIDVGDDCTTGFGGGCDPGRLECVDASAVCVSLRPQAVEVCDDYDNDCDEDIDEEATDATVWYRDSDNDRFGDPDDTVRACAAPEGYVADTGDCDDASSSVNPNAVELCDGVDNNCDGDTDLADAVGARTWYQDGDEDTFGNPAVSVFLCAAPAGYVADNTDCDDLRGDIRPNALELCDGLDNDCDGDTDEDSADDAPRWYADSDDDGFGDTNALLRRCLQPEGYVADNTDCDDDADTSNPAADEVCDGEDNDCDRTVDEPDAVGAPIWYADTDRDGFGDPDVAAPACAQPVGFVAVGTDCDDSRDEVYPDADELCDGVDNDCDELTDEDGRSAWYEDADLDGFGDPAVTVLACGRPAGYVANNTDCAPAVQTINPVATEVCDTVDNDCDTLVDEELVRSCYTGPAGTVNVGLCRTGTQTCNAGDWGLCNGETLPAAETCDALDNDCDGPADEGNPGGAITCDTGESGVCSTGVTACVSGAIVCNRVTAPQSELCDGLDNDCDGSADEGNPGSGLTCTTGLSGLCAVGVTTCSDGSISCTQTTFPAGEVCDGLDNDCDGPADEGNPGGGLTCGTGLAGVCDSGTTACVSGATVCNQNITASAEICDGLDNNCNGSQDEGNPGSGLPCDTGAQGICAAGTTGCSGGGIVCNQNQAQGIEACDGVDNDCDGSVDEGNPGGGAACSTGQAGVCAAGTLVCSGAQLVCQRNVGPSAEICDGVDNDCDNSIDNGFNKNWWWDRDGDGFGDPSGFVFQCGQPNAFYVQNGNDANDSTQFIHPGRTEICDGVDNDQDGASDEDSVCSNPAGGGTCAGRYDSGLNRGYMFCRASSNRNRDAHRNRCTGKGMDLAYPSNDTENEFIRNTAENGGVFSGGFGQMWFGVQRRNTSSGNWFWIADNVDQGYTNFRSGEPSGDGPCANMEDNGRWNDAGCSNNRDEAVCEWPAENVRRF